MKTLTIILGIVLLLAGCASQNRNQEIPIHELSIGIKKEDVIAKLGKPHRVVSSQLVNNINYQVWAYQQDKLIWLSGNSFLGGRTRNDQVIYLLYFENDKLAAWKDNDFQSGTKTENTFEIRNK